MLLSMKSLHLKVYQTAIMGLLVKIIGEHEVSLSLGKHVKSGQDKNRTVIYRLLKVTQKKDLKAIIAATLITNQEDLGVTQQIPGKDGNTVSINVKMVATDTRGSTDAD